MLLSEFNPKKLLNAILAFVKPEVAGDISSNLSAAYALTERNSFSQLLTYQHFDEELNICYLEDGPVPAVGFLLAMNPLMVAGTDTEDQFEAIIHSMPPDTILQVGKLATPQIEGFINRWTNSRLEKNNNELLRNIALQRREFMLHTATENSMLQDTRLHPRMMQWYLAVRIPYKGSLKEEVEITSFLRTVVNLRESTQGALKAAGMDSVVCKEADLKYMLREMLNPQQEPLKRLQDITPDAPLSQDVVSQETRVSVQADGRLKFKNGDDDEGVLVTVLTVDSTPKTVYLSMMARTLGDPVSWTERVTCPYWAYTTIHVLHPDDSKDKLLANFGLLNKQTMSESPWFRSMMGHLYDRKDRAGALLQETNNGRTLVRAYTGINLFTAPDDARPQAEHVKGLYRRAGFRLSEEKYISLPVFLASLPLQYSAAMDPPNKGLQRASLMSSLNASSLLQVQGDWRGTGEDKGGMLLVSRAGQVATFDLLQTTINYNFIIVAASGSGKSFLANEIIGDFLSKGGIARIIDVGRSYARFCEIMGGQNLIFSPETPVSLNPFSDIKTEADLDEMMPMLKDLLRLMAYPLTPEADTPPYQYQLLEKAITEAWRKGGTQTDLQDVVQWLRNYTGDGTNRAQDLALQLEPFSHGRYKRWFTGPRTVQFNKSLVVIELEELKQDSALQAVVLQLMMYQTTKEMYLSDRKIPKLLAIDEAWDLMGGLSTGRFIETAFRRMRKYNGIAGVITQSFEDFEKSSASKAAIENAAWQFILYQRAESISFAVDNKRLTGDEMTLNLIRSVKSGNGFSEVFVKGEQGSGLYRFVTDKHSYYTFTSKASDVNRLNDLIRSGMTTEEAINTLAMRDYEKMWENA